MTSLFLLGAGTVGGALLDLLPRLPELRLVGVATSTRHAFSPLGLDPAAWTATTRRGALPLAALAACPNPVLVDCTAADDLVDVYEAALALGIDVVAANKTIVVGHSAVLDRLTARAAASGAQLRYEATVGAALPIVDTLRHMRRTGDEVHRIEGLLSGSLGFICAQLNRGGALDEAVERATALGLLEPRPQADLSGLDVARKAVILARLSGRRVELSDVRVEPLVPPELLAIEDPSAFRAALRAQRDPLRAWFERLRRPGHVLRYCAEVGPDGLRVGPRALPLDHPAAWTRAEQAWIAVHSARYGAHPLILQGAGAGGAVTASGVLADILRLADRGVASARSAQRTRTVPRQPAA